MLYGKVEPWLSEPSLNEPSVVRTAIIDVFERQSYELCD